MYVYEIMFCVNVSGIIISYLELVEIQVMGSCGNEIAKKLSKKIMNNRFEFYDYILSRRVEDVIHIPARDVFCWLPKRVDLYDINDDMKRCDLENKHIDRNIREFLNYPEALELARNKKGVKGLLGRNEKMIKFLKEKMPTIMYAKEKRLYDLVPTKVMEYVVRSASYRSPSDSPLTKLVAMHIRLFGKDDKLMEIMNTIKFDMTDVYYELDDPIVLNPFAPIPLKMCIIGNGKIEILKSMSKQLIESYIDSRSALYSRQTYQFSEKIAECIAYIMVSYPEIVTQNFDKFFEAIVFVGQIYLMVMLLEICPKGLSTSRLRPGYLMGDFAVINYLYEKCGRYVFTDVSYTSSVTHNHSNKNMKRYIEIYTQYLTSKTLFDVMNSAIFSCSLDSVRYLLSQYSSLKMYADDIFNKDEKKYIQM